MKYWFKSIKLNFEKYDYELSGFSKRNLNELVGIEALYTKIVWFKNNSNFIIISIDLLYIPEELSSEIFSFLKEEYNINKNQVIFNATHTHSAPGIDRNFDKNFDKKIIQYLEKEIKLSFSNILFKNGNIQFNSFQLKNKMYISRRKIGRDIRRFFLQKRTIMLPNNDKVIDDSIRNIIVYDEKQKIKLLIYNFSCHPVFNTSNKISSDFIGTISSQLNKKIGIESIFLQGFSGDIRPNFTVTQFKNLNIVDKLKLFFNKEIFKRFDKKNFNLFCAEISNNILNQLSIDKTISENNNEIFIFNEFEFELFSNTKKTSKHLTTKLVLLKNNIFISIPAEVNSTYYVKLSNIFKKLNIIPLGLADNVIGYLPFSTEIQERGYEVDSYINYGWDSSISEESLRFYFLRLEKEIKKIEDDL